MLNKNSKLDEGKFETENRRRAEKLLKKQFGLKPVDSWRKHKKALNAAKYYEELPATEKMNSNQEHKVPVESKPDPKIVKTIKSNKKISISLPVIKQINITDSPVTTLNSSLPEVAKKPIASVAPYQIILPKQPNVTVVQPERINEKINVSKSKTIQAAHNKNEKDSTTIRPVISKKSISDDDGLLVEYKCMKKKNKTERKSSLQPPTPSIISLVVAPVAPPAVFKPKVQTVERFHLPETTKSKVQSDERFSSSEVIKVKVQTVDVCNSPEAMKSKNLQSLEQSHLPEPVKSKVHTVEDSSDVIKPKAQIMERCNSPEITKQNSYELVLPNGEKEKKETSSLNEISQEYQQSNIEKKITVLKRDSDEKHVNLSPTVTNKHGNTLFYNNIQIKIS